MIFRLKKNKFKINKHILLYYGLGRSQMDRLMQFFGFSLNSTTEIERYEIIDIELFIRKNYILEYHLKLNINKNVNRLILSKNYKGFRHKFKLPVNGQNSRVNSSTIKKYVLPFIDKNYIDDKQKLLEKFNNF